MRLQSVIFPLLLFASLGWLDAGKERHAIQDAIKAGLISCEFRGDDASPHYVRPLKATLTNNTSRPIEIAIANGLQFTADDPAYQNLMITNSGTIYLSPNEKKEMPLYAMCTESSDNAPASDVKYNLSSASNAHLKAVAKYIEEKKLHNTTGQQAVWCLSNGHELACISGFDTAETRGLQRLVSKITGRPLPPPPTADDYEHNYYTPPREEVSYKGIINFGFSEKHAVSIGLFNERNVLVRELYNNPAEPAGTRKVEYAFDNSVYTEPVYFVRMIMDGDVMINRRIEMN